MDVDRAEEALDQLVDRALRGESVTSEVVARDYPDLDEPQRRRISRVLALLQGQAVSATEGHGGDELPHERLGPYLLQRSLGGGGMGMVYLARHETLERDVALKLIRPSLASSTTAGQRFRREAKAVARLRHPHIATVHDAGEDGGVPYLAMEYVPGQGLDEILAAAVAKGETVPVVDAARWARDVARALACAHEEGLIHRDVKPSNIRITPEGRAVLLDFGLVVGAELHAVSQDQNFRGTAHYASPEQVAARSVKLDPRTDLYSLGVTLYEAVTGQVPFRGETTEQVFHQILSRSPRFPRKLNAAISRDLEAVILGCLEKERERRYASAAALADDLDALLEMRPVRIRPPTGLQRALQWTRRRPAAAAALALAAVVVVGGPLGYGLLSRAFSEEVAAQRDEANRQRAEVLRLADVLVVKDLLTRAEELWPRRPERVAAMEAWLEESRAVLQRCAAHEDTRTRLAAMADDPQVRWQRQTTEELLASLGQLDAVATEVEGRAAFAREIEARSVERYAEEWQDVIDQVAIEPIYDGLELEPLVGLVPLGLDPDTGLAEFVHLETGEVPVRDEDSGALAVEEASGVVFVLIPGGVYEMGSDKSRDHHANPNEGPVREVTVAPFLLAKHEVTQAQWRRITGTEPSGYGPSTGDGQKLITWSHPVESVTYEEALLALGRLGLNLPTEQQWEYAARAGTSDPWWSGADPRALAHAANLVDQYCRRNGGHPSWTYESWDDGYSMHAPVGSYRPNPFGLHDMIGNVEEWCLDQYRSYARAGEAAPVPMDVDGAAVPLRVVRGGSFLSPATEARCAVRYVHAQSERSNHRGVRAVMGLGR